MNARAVERFDKMLAGLLLVTAAIVPLGIFLKTFDASMVKEVTLQGAAVLAAALFVARALEAGRFEWPARLNSVIFLGLGYWFLTAVSPSWNPHPDVSAFAWFRQLALVTIFLVAAAGPASMVLAARLADATIAAAAAAAAYGVIQAAGLDPLSWKGAFGSASFSTLANPAFLGVYCAAGATLAAARLLDPFVGSVRRGLLAMAALLCAGGVCVSSSAVGMLAFVVGWAVLGARLWGAKDARLRAAGLAACVLAAAVFSAALWAGSSDRLLNRLSDLRSAARGSLKMAAQRPVRGWGAGSFASVFPEYQGPGRAILPLDAQPMAHPGSEPLRIAAELGALGALAALGLALLVIVPGFKDGGRRLSAGDLRGGVLSCGVFAAFVSLLAAGLASDVLASPAVACLAAILGACAASISRPAAAAIVEVAPLALPRVVRTPASIAVLFFGFAMLSGPMSFAINDFELNGGMYQARHQRVDEALERLRRVVPSHRYGSLAKYTAAHLLAERNRGSDSEKSLELLKNLETFDPAFAQLALRKGMLEMRLARFKDAEASLERFARLKPGSAQVWERLVEIKWILRRPEEARRAALQLVKLEPGSSEAWRLLGQTYKQLQRPAIARRMERKAVRVGELARRGALP